MSQSTTQFDRLSANIIFACKACHEISLWAHLQRIGLATPTNSPRVKLPMTAHSKVIFPSITHVIFDVDGLLLDTESLYTQCISDFCAQYGKEFSHTVKERMMGRGAREGAEELIKSLGLPCTVDEYLQTKSSWHARYLPLCKLMPGAERLVQHFTKHHVHMCLATGSSEETFFYKTQRYETLLKHFCHIVLTSDKQLRHGKPAPDIFLLAASRFQPPPESSARCLVFEDSPNGIEAAIAAQMQVIAVPHPLTDLSRYREHPQVHIIESLNHFQPEQFGLPRFE